MHKWRTRLRLYACVCQLLLLSNWSQQLQNFSVKWQHWATQPANYICIHIKCHLNNLFVKECMTMTTELYELVFKTWLQLWSRTRGLIQMKLKSKNLIKHPAISHAYAIFAIKAWWEIMNSLFNSNSQCY